MQRPRVPRGHGFFKTPKVTGNKRGDSAGCRSKGQPDQEGPCFQVKKGFQAWGCCNQKDHSKVQKKILKG